MGSLQGPFNSPVILIIDLFNSLSAMVGLYYQWMVDERRRPIINWTGSLHAFLFFPFLIHLQLIDFIITTHPAYQELVKLGQEQKKNIHTGISLHDPFIPSFYWLNYLLFSLSSRRKTGETQGGKWC